MSAEQSNISTDAPAKDAAPSSAIVPTGPKAVAPPVAFNADDPVSLYMNAGVFEQLQRVAMMMAKANLVPGHLRGNEKIADCFLVAAQAFRWGMDPFSVAQHTFVTQGKLGYEGKLIAGLINASGKLTGNLKPVYSGDGQNRKVVIVGRLRTEPEDRTIEGTVGGWATSNEKWKQMPDQMLFYRGAREWARRHMPEVMLGISGEDEIVEMERGPGGVIVAAPPKGLVELTQKLEARVAEDRAAGPCSHPDIPPSKLSGLKHGQSIPCPKCGEALENPDAPEPQLGKPPEGAPAAKQKSQGRLVE